MALKYSLSEEQLTIVGKIHSCFGTIEHVLQILIFMAYGLNISRGRHLTQRMDLQQKISVLKDIAPESFKGSAAVEQFNKVVPRIRSLTDERNRLTHATWAISERTSEPIAVTFKLWGNIENMTRASKLPELLGEAEDVQSEVLEILMTLHSEGYKPA